MSGNTYANPMDVAATSPAMTVASSGLNARADSTLAEAVSTPINGYNEVFTMFLKSWLSEMTLAS